MTANTLITKLHFQLSDLSTYRAELMGWSIIWIMMLHFRFITLKPLGFIAQYGFAGVEIFMFVSGLGLYYSLAKGPSLPAFYLKRFRRIFPTYYFVGIFASLLLFGDTLPLYLFRYTTIGFWTGGPFFEWYIPSIVALYIAAPFVKRLITTRGQWLLLLLCVVVLASAYFAASDQTFSREHFFFYYRLPAFVGGMYCGKFIKQQSGTRAFLALAAAGIPLFALFFPKHHAIAEFKYYAVFFLLPLFMIALCTLSKLLSRLLGRASAIIRQTGNASLEVYLIQTLFFSAICSQQLVIAPRWHDIATLCLMAGCTVAGILLHKLTSRLLP